MPVFISDDMLLTEVQDSITSNANSPRIGIQNLSNQSNIYSSAGELSSNPAWLTSVPSTADRWKNAPNLIHVWTMDATGFSVDYVGIAAHRGLIGRQIQVQAVINGTLTTILESRIVISSDPIFILFDEIEPTNFYVIISSDSAFDIEVGIINVGKSVFLPRNIYVGHTPLKYGRATKKLNATSDSGSYLGNRINKVSRASSVSMDNVPPLFYRDYLYLQFHIPSETRPFFWAWRPSTYPEEAGFCWINGDVNIQNSNPNGYMNMSFDITGYVNNG
jgi:hypothetical protein